MSCEFIRSVGTSCLAYPKESGKNDLSAFLVYRGDRIRTYDIQLPKLALYQAELHPEKVF